MYNCDKRYLNIVLALKLLPIACAIGLSVIYGNRDVRSLFLILGSLLAVASLLPWFTKKTWKFSINNQDILTEKIFTKHVDTKIPLKDVLSINAKEGVIEALCNVGTLEITTASSNPDYATILWSHIKNHREVAQKLEDMIKNTLQRG